MYWTAGIFLLMKYIVKESELRKMIAECIMESIQEGTNMLSLYHFTNLSGLYGILKSGSISTNSRQRYIRNGKNYVAFTRHKSAVEGFALPSESTVRIEVDGTALSNIRNSNVGSFEFYSPDRTQRTRARTSQRFGAYGLSAKEKYANAKKPNDVYNFDDEEYMNQAEESFETDADSINVNKIVKRIDVFIGNKKDLSFILSTNSPLLDKVYVYNSFKDFSYQTNKCKRINDLQRFNFGFFIRKAGE